MAGDAAEIDEVLGAARLTATGPPTRLTSVSNRVYLVDTTAGRVVIRLSTRRRLGVDHAREARTASAAAALGLAPEVVFHDPATGALITIAINADPATPARVRDDPDVRARIGRALARLHDGPTFEGEFDPFAIIDALTARLAPDDPALPQIGVARRALEPVRAMRALAPRRPCHNDPWPGNVIIVGGGGVLLVDWEYAAQNDPAWDLADLSVEAALDDDAEADLLAAYSGDAPDADLAARVTATKPLADLLWAVWSFNEHGSGNPSDDFVTEGSRRLDLATQRLES